MFLTNYLQKCKHGFIKCHFLCVQDIAWLKLLQYFLAGRTVVTAAIDLRCVFPSPLPVFKVFYKWVAAAHEGNTHTYGIYTTLHQRNHTQQEYQEEVTHLAQDVI